MSFDFVLVKILFIASLKENSTDVTFVILLRWTRIFKKRIKIDAAEPERSSFLFYILLPCQNLVPTLPTMLIVQSEICKISGFPL